MDCSWYSRFLFFECLLFYYDCHYYVQVYKFTLLDWHILQYETDRSTIMQISTDVHMVCFLLTIVSAQKVAILEKKKKKIHGVKERLKTDTIISCWLFGFIWGCSKLTISNDPDSVWYVYSINSTVSLHQLIDRFVSSYFPFVVFTGLRYVTQKYVS